MKLGLTILVCSISVGSLVAVGNSNYMTVQEYLKQDHEFDESLGLKCLHSCCGLFLVDAWNGSHPHIPRYIEEIARCVEEGNDRQAHYYIQWLINHGKTLNSYREFLNELIKAYPKYREVFVFLIDAEYLTTVEIRKRKLIKYAIDCENISSIKFLSKALKLPKKYDHDEIMLSSLFMRNNISSTEVRKAVYNQLFNVNHQVSYVGNNRRSCKDAPLSYEQTLGCDNLVAYLKSLTKKNN